MLNTILIFDNIGISEELTSPPVDLSSKSNPILTFDIAFNYMKYTPPYFTADVFFTDTLEILISTDNGENYQSIYKKYGEELATTEEPIENPLSIENCIFYPSSDEWRQDTIDLADYSEVESALFKFQLSSGLGGSINIDNFKIDSFDPTSVIDNNIQSINLSPNPATEHANIYFNVTEYGQYSLKIMDLLGNVINEVNNLEGIGEFSQTIDVSKLTSGIYLIKIESKNGARIGKLIVN
jgi:hypothetical protein